MALQVAMSHVLEFKACSSPLYLGQQLASALALEICPLSCLEHISLSLSVSIFISISSAVPIPCLLWAKLVITS